MNAPRWATTVIRYALVLAPALVLGLSPSLSVAFQPAAVAVYRIPTGQWFILDPVTGPRVVAYGCAGCGTHFPVPHDYNGDGVDDIAIVAIGPPSAEPGNALFLPWE